MNRRDFFRGALIGREIITTEELFSWQIDGVCSDYGSEYDLVEGKPKGCIRYLDSNLTVQGRKFDGQATVLSELRSVI